MRASRVLRTLYATHAHANAPRNRNRNRNRDRNRNPASVPTPASSSSARRIESIRIESTPVVLVRHAPHASVAMRCNPRCPSTSRVLRPSSVVVVCGQSINQTIKQSINQSINQSIIRRRRRRRVAKSARDRWRVEDIFIQAHPRARSRLVVRGRDSSLVVAIGRSRSRSSSSGRSVGRARALARSLARGRARKHPRGGGTGAISRPIATWTTTRRRPPSRDGFGLSFPDPSSRWVGRGRRRGDGSRDRDGLLHAFMECTKEHDD